MNHLAETTEYQDILLMPSVLRLIEIGCAGGLFKTANHLRCNAASPRSRRWGMPRQQTFISLLRLT